VPCARITKSSSLESIASKLAIELDRLKKLDRDVIEKDAISIKEQLIKELRECLTRKNSEVD